MPVPQVIILNSMPSFSIQSEIRSLIRIGWPICVTQLAQSGIATTDTLMAGRVGAVDLAGVALGASIWMPVFLFMTGVIIATTALVSHAYGGGRDREIVSTVRQACWMALGLGLLAFFLCRSSNLYLGWLNLEPEVQAVAEGYLNGIAWGIPAMAIYQVLRCYCEAQTDTSSVMVLTLLGLIVNIPANYLFIFGGLGISPMGGAGCGYASALVMWIGLALMILNVQCRGRYRHHQLFNQWQRPDAAQLSGLLRLGVPIGLAIFFEAGLFGGASLALAPLGAITLAAHQIAISVTSLVFMVPLSIAMATTVRVGNLLGKNAFHQARLGSLCAVGLGLTIACLTATVMTLAALPIARLFTPDIQVQQLAASILVIAALFQFSDVVQVTCSGALRAYKDTRAVMLITLFAYWILGFPIALWLAYADTPALVQGVQGFWVGLVIGLTAAAILLLRRLLRISRPPQPPDPAWHRAHLGDSPQEP